jgi:O-antigen/teichoic acid export membrane protein
LLASWVAGPALGCYTLGNKIGAVAGLAFASPLALAWPSFLAQVGQDRETALQYGRLVEWLVMYAAGLYLCLVLPVEGWVRLLGGHAYEAAVPLVPILAAATVIGAFQPVLMSGFGLAMRFRLVPIIAAGSAGLNLGLNLWCVPRFGPIGAAWTTLLACGVSATVGRYFSQQLWPLPVDWRRALLPVAWAALLAIVGSRFSPWQWRMTLLPLYPLGVWLIRRRLAAVPAAPLPAGTL